MGHLASKVVGRSCLSQSPSVQVRCFPYNLNHVVSLAADVTPVDAQGASAWPIVRPSISQQVQLQRLQLPQKMGRLSSAKLHAQHSFEVHTST